MTFNIVNYL